MPKREKITLGDKEFKNKKEAARYVRSLMEGHSPGKHLIGKDFKLVLDLIKRFPDADKKIGLGIEDLIIRAGTGSDLYFEIVRPDGSITTCGYKNAFYPKRRPEMTSFKYLEVSHKDADNETKLNQLTSKLANKPFWCGTDHKIGACNKCY